MSRYLNLVKWHGGKYPHLKWLLEQFPKGDHHFIDLMCGAANVALNVDYPLITVNDLNSDIVNLFRVLRDHRDELIERIYLTPFSREELYDCLEAGDSGDIIEEARRYFLRCQLGYGGNGGQHRHAGTCFEKKLQRSNHYAVDNWNNKPDRLYLIAARLRQLQIEHMDALELLGGLDRPGNLIYVDPPYLKGARYRHGVDIGFHRRLAAGLVALEHAKFAISGIEHPLYEELYGNLNRFYGPLSGATVGKKKVREVLWTNYRLTGRTLYLFGQ